jgi:NAD-dependent dihydropyrimidine dehydrogenase PreA subunit
MKTTRKIVEIDEERCDGCGQCVLSCAEGAIEIIDGKARLVSENYCDGLGACLGECPQGALHIIEREADEFDPEAVEHHLARQQDKVQQLPMTGGCPSARVQVFHSAAGGGAPSGELTGSPSALSHWPVQIRLVPPQAPFLKGAHLLVAADCAPVAYADFHRDFVKDRVVLLGCPKFDDVPEYLQRFEQIFRVADIRTVTVVDMEVPCCSALPGIVKKAMGAAGKQIPLEEIVVGVRGQILTRDQTAA